MLNYSNPYDVLSETISFENVQLMSEMITLKTLRGRYAYSRQGLDWLYVGLVKDLNRSNDTEHVFSDAYDFVQNAVCFLCEFVGKKLTDVYTVKNGQEITIKQATYSLVGRNIDRMSRHILPPIIYYIAFLIFDKIFQQVGFSKSACYFI